MKAFLLILGLTLATLFTYSQNFEGEIVYKVNVITTLPAALQQQLKAMIGDRQEFIHICGADHFTSSKIMLDSFV